MHILLVLDASDLRRWHARAAERLGAVAGVTVGVRLVETPPRPSGDLLFRLESLIYRVPAGHPAERITRKDLPLAEAAPRADLVLDLSGAEAAATAPPTFRLSCNGAGPDPGALDAILAGAIPVLSLDLAVDGYRRTVGRWAVAVEEPGVAVRGVATVFGRAVQMLEQVTGAVVAGQDPRSVALSVASPETPSRRPAAPLRYGAARLGERIARRITRHLGTAPRWFTGWRRIATSEPDVPALRGTDWSRLPDDGRRFFADPFVWRAGGRDILFVEEFPFETGKGIISAAEIGSDGTISQARPVLETDCHLSYPFVFEVDGTIYMVPETSGRRTVELWRAREFPDRWEQAAVLIEGVDLGDATLVRRSDSWLLFAASRAEWTSSWDALAIYAAPALLGPWRPLLTDPVLVDVSAARPAGRVIEANGRMVRPVQDCAVGYGAGIAFAAVDRVGPDGFAQTVLDRVRPKGLSGLHTYNRHETIEVVDAFGNPAGPRFTIR